MLETDQKTPYLFLFPGSLMMLLLVFIPLFMGISYSFTNMTQRNANTIQYRIPEKQADGSMKIRVENEPAKFKLVGFKNYIDILSNS